jgi:hypothetical protein
MSTSVMVVLFMMGAAGGFPIGRWWAENSRGAYEARSAWDKRAAYRNRD